MMSFDQELDSIEKKLNAFSLNSISDSDADSKLLALQQRLLQIEAAIPKWMQTFSLTQKQIQALKRENLAVIQWSAKLAKLAKTHYELFSRHSDQAFWLSLMVDRISQSQDSANDEEFDELVNLVIKISEISEVEETFNSELRTLDAIQAKLLKEYAQLGIADANWDASGSMQARLSEKNNNAFENAPSRGLSDLLKLIRANLSWRSDEHLRNQERRLERLSDRLAQTGKNLSSKISAQHASTTVQKLTPEDGDKLKNLIQELTDFERLFARQFETYVDKLPKDPKPRLNPRT